MTRMRDLLEEHYQSGRHNECERVPVLCGCGWGHLAMPECEVPDYCPLCGNSIRWND